MGFIAQEVRTEFVSMNYISLIPVLTGAIQEQQAEIDTQNQRIEKLEEENATLQARMDQLEAIFSQLNK